jgi:23S rRNA (cytidine2498-2'-O)-methyltransferase
VHLVLSADDSRSDLERELGQSFAGARELAPGLFAAELVGDAWPYLAFARQVLPDAREQRAASIKAWAAILAEAVVGVLPDDAPWSLHVIPFREVVSSSRQGARAWHSRARTGAAHAEREQVRQGAGLNRCRLIGEALVELLQKRRRHLLRGLRKSSTMPNAQPAPFSADEALVQLLLTSPEAGYLSVASAPLPFSARHVLSHFPGGQVPPAIDKQAPSRAFAKLVEAELRLGRRISARETCVDLGAAPGSWTYVAARRGARVTAVDRSELRGDLMRSKGVRFHQGDAFRFEPAAPVDWLICDVIAAAERSAELLLRWLRQGWCQNFVVTLKLDDSGSEGVLNRLKQELPALTGELGLSKLCANKKEVCAFGSASARVSAASDTLAES